MVVWENHSYRCDIKKEQAETEKPEIEQVNLNTIIMKNYQKPKVLAKNNPTGSYAAGCPEKQNGTSTYCKNCERTK